MVPEVEDLIYKTTNWANFDDSEQSLKEMKLLFSILYVDKGDSTCLSRDMLKAELEKLLYTRWSAEGSLYMASQHSMIFMSGSDFPKFFPQRLLFVGISGLGFDYAQPEDWYSEVF